MIGVRWVGCNSPLAARDIELRAFLYLRMSRREDETSEQSKVESDHYVVFMGITFMKMPEE